MNGLEAERQLALGADVVREQDRISLAQEAGHRTRARRVGRDLAAVVEETVDEEALVATDEAPAHDGPRVRDEVRSIER